MILMLQILDVTANENARNKSNELELTICFQPLETKTSIFT